MVAPELLREVYERLGLERFHRDQDMILGLGSYPVPDRSTLPRSERGEECCPSCQGIGCVDCYNQGTWRVYATEQMYRLRVLLRRSGIPV